ncbi:MAG: TIGR00269 family protein [Candidatus Hadarchaeum sp.]|uniref:TIGR00269 family protein n=1 Tax=Candidatus Hadarchaeum sp. TaxID=2883567 RepID=UPI003D139528
MLRCSFCGRRAVYHRRYAGVFLCDRCMIKSVERRFRRAVNNYRLVLPGERVAVAVSGGKDSVACLHLLTNYCRGKRCEVVAITVDEGIRGYRDESLPVARENAEVLGVEHYVISFKSVFGVTLDEMVKIAAKRGTGLNPCTYCGVMRRSLLNQAARELSADKLATGHNLDDETQAIMLNYVRADLSRLYRLGPIYIPLEGFVPRIKPLREIPEKEVALYALLKGIKVHLAVCPYASGIHTEIRDFLNSLEANHPNSKFMILRMFEEIKPHLKSATPEFEVKRCERCGEPTSTRLCKTCELLQGLGLAKGRKNLISERDS